MRQDIRTVEVRARGFVGKEGDWGDFEVLTADDRKVPLAQPGTVEVRYEDPVIKRYNREPFVAAHAEVRGAQPNDVTAAPWFRLGR